MASTEDFPAGGFAYVPGVFQYSGGVRALPGFRIERIRFARPVPLAAGFAQIAAILRDQSRPLTAFCACELRSPAPFTEDGFQSFNRAYAKTLTEWGVMVGDRNPVARSNVCPDIGPPAEPSFHAFCFTRPHPGAMASFMVSGSGEVPEGRANYRDHIVRAGDTSVEGMRAKADFVMAEMTRRLSALGANWSAVTATQVYTVHAIHSFLPDMLMRHGIAAAHGITWHFARPPIVGLDFEMDCRAIAVERVVAG